MSSSTSFQKFQLHWKPSKQILIFQSLILLTALLCIDLTSPHWSLKCFLAVSVVLYTRLTLGNYWHSPQVSFYLQQSKLIAQQENNVAFELQSFQWFDWGYIVVLTTKHAGKNRHWFWLLHHLNAQEKRNLRLMIRTFIKKECHSMPSITTNPVL